VSTEISASPGRSVALAGARGTAVLRTALEQIRSFTAQPAVARSLPALGFVAFAGLVALAWMALSTPPSRDLFRGLPDAEKAAVADALRTSGIQYSIDRDTGTLSVPDKDYYQARMLLASQGLPKSAPDANETVNNLPLGASRAVEGERLRTAREIDLARTIEAIDAVQSARVHLALEEPSVFVREESKPSASVLVTLQPGRTLSEQQVNAIVHLVASSVPGLPSDRVSVVDQSGRLLSNEGGDALTDATERQVAVQAKIESRYLQSIEALLTPILGAGNFTAQVHADVDFSEVQATREGFPKEASTLSSEQGEISTASGDASGGGIPGALSNQPPSAAQVAAAPGGALTTKPAGAPDAAAPKRNENYTRSFAVGREVSITRQQTGQVKRLSVAVALKDPDTGKPRTPQEIAAIDQLVKGAIGFDGRRGDVVAVGARRFAPVDEPTESWWQATWVSMLARNLSALGVVALLVFGLGKPLMKKGAAALARRAEAQAANRTKVRRQIAAAVAVESRTNPDAQVTLDMIEVEPSYEARAALIRSFVRQDPARAALVVRDLIRTGAKEDHRNG